MSERGTEVAGEAERYREEWRVQERPTKQGGGEVEKRHDCKRARAGQPEATVRDRGRRRLADLKRTGGRLERREGGRKLGGGRGTAQCSAPLRV